MPTTPPRRILFKRPPNPLDRVEPPKRTRGDEDDHSAFAAYHHDQEKDMLDNAWLAIKTPAETSKNETLTEAQSVEPMQKDVDNLLVTVSFSLDEETIQQICSNPDPETAFNVMVKRRRAEVKVSTLSAEQKRELCQSERQGTQHVCQIFCGRGGITSRNLTVCVDENAFGCDVQR